MMRHVLLVSLLVFAVQALANDERILDYHSEIRIQADASVEVTEHIRVRSLQRNIRRGIYRDFPTRYRDHYGNRVVVDFEVLEVLRDGEPEPWFTESRSNGIRVNTGGDDLLPGPGEYTFSIRYRTQRQLGFFDEHDELYWNVTGLGWDFPIDRASAELNLPEAVPAAQIRLDSYTGPAGAEGSHARSWVPEPGLARFETSRALAPAEGLTIVVGFPKGIVTEPTRGQRFQWLLHDNRGLLVMLASLVLVLAFYLHAWNKRGRDPEKGIIIARYEPPTGYSPAGLRYVVRRGYDQRCFSADIVDMAVHGLLRIDRDKRTFKDDWTLIKARDSVPPDTTPSQAALFPKLFEKDAELPLKPAQASQVSGAMQAHMSALKKRYSGDYIDHNYPTLVIGWIASALLIALSLVIGGGDALLGTIGVAVLLLFVNLAFTSLMSRPTEAGRRLLDHIEGLKMYLSVAERDELKNLEHRAADEPELTPQRYEALLPYALALGVEDAWTGKFTATVGEALASQTQNNIAWYTGSGAALGSLGNMSQSLGKNLSNTISSSASPPGSSSGGGGGGFSGGGGGGGGGGGR